MTILIFGATGTAGSAVLRVALAAPDVTEMRAIVRRPLELTHPKLRTWVHDDFTYFEPVAGACGDIDACFYCLGRSVTQVPDEAAYRRITYDFAVAAATAVTAGSPAAAFHFISGGSASETSRFMWARVKAETERRLRADFQAICWRPGFIDGELSASAPWSYRALQPLARLLSPITSLYVTGTDIGRAMLRATREGMRDRIVENREIRAMAADSPDR